MTERWADESLRKERSTFSIQHNIGALAFPCSFQRFRCKLSLRSSTSPFGPANWAVVYSLHEPHTLDLVRLGTKSGGLPRDLETGSWGLDHSNLNNVADPVIDQPACS